MSKSRASRVAYVDVDNTLVRKVAGEEMPDPDVIKLVRRPKRRGARLYCRSTGGAAHARRAALKCRIASLFEGFLSKPNLLLDDERVTEWPDCHEVSPKDDRRAIHASMKAIAKRSSAR